MVREQALSASVWWSEPAAAPDVHSYRSRVHARIGTLTWIEWRVDYFTTRHLNFTFMWSWRVKLWTHQVNICVFYILNLVLNLLLVHCSSTAIQLCTLRNTSLDRYIEKHQNPYSVMLNRYAQETEWRPNAAVGWDHHPLIPLAPPLVQYSCCVL